SVRRTVHCGCGAPSPPARRCRNSRLHGGDAFGCEPGVRCHVPHALGDAVAHSETVTHGKTVSYVETVTHGKAGARPRQTRANGGTHAEPPRDRPRRTSTRTEGARHRGERGAGDTEATAADRDDGHQGVAAN